MRFGGEGSIIKRIRYIACNIMEGENMDPKLFKTSGVMIRLSNALIWFRNQELQTYDLTSSQFEVVRYLLKHREANTTAGDLMRQLELSQSTVAGILKRLCAKGLIERRSDENDARRDFVTLTEKGIALEDSLQGIACKTEHILLQGMSEAERSELERLLNIALENINSARSGGEQAK